MNYITHLNAFFDRVSGDGRLTAYHISLYLAVFQLWNLNRFSETFPVNRTELMVLSRVRSVNTYARCMKELDSWGYFYYSASANCHGASEITGIRFDIGNHTSNAIGEPSGDDILTKTGNKQRGNQSSSPNIGNGKKKKATGKGNYHAPRNKDYSEPL